MCGDGGAARRAREDARRQKEIHEQQHNERMENLRTNEAAQLEQLAADQEALRAQQQANFDTRLAESASQFESSLAAQAAQAEEARASAQARYDAQAAESEERYQTAQAQAAARLEEQKRIAEAPPPPPVQKSADEVAPSIDEAPALRAKMRGRRKYRTSDGIPATTGAATSLSIPAASTRTT